MKVTIASALALVLVAPAAQGRKLQGDTAKRDWSKVAKQFNLHEHLMKPTTRDLREGVESSRRLAANAVRLGVDTELHRQLVAENPPSDVVTQFDESTPLPSTGPRVKVDDTVDALPFSDGPGIFPGIPEGTRAFWLEGGAPTKMWEVVACPVADVESWLENPLRCLFGGDNGSVMDFISQVADTALDAIMDDAIIPIATEAIWTFSGLAWLEQIFGTVCDILGIVDDIINFVKDAFGGASDFFSDAVDSFTSGFGLWRRLADGEAFASCSEDHFATCNDDTSFNCDDCLVTSNSTCGNCRTCYKPFRVSTPDMDGLCLPTADLRDVISGEVIPVHVTQGLNTAMLANYIKKTASDDVVGAITTALGTDGSSQDQDPITTLIDAAKTSINTNVDQAETSINTNVDQAETSINTNVDQAETSINSNIDDTCSSTRRRGLGSATTAEEEKTSSAKDFLETDAAKEAKQHAASLGLSTEQADEIFTKLLEGLSGDAASSFNGNIDDKIKSSLKDPEVLGKLEELLGAGLEKDHDGFAIKMASGLIKTAVDPETSKLDSQKLRDIQAALKGMQKTRKLGLEETCDGLLDEIKNFIKGIIQTLLEGLIGGLNAALDGVDNAFDTVLDNEIYGDALDLVESSSGFLMPFGLVGVMDPWSVGGALQQVMSSVVDVFQTIVGFLLFDCNVFEASCNAVLPSVENKILPIFENREKTAVFMNSGCNSEFEGELAWYKPAHEILSKLLDEAGKSIIEFINIPINVIKFILDAAAKLFDHMNDVCEYLDGYVQLGKVEATFENSRWALHELACRLPPNLLLQRGYGCDGIDNTCDDDKQIDECAEDIFPPEIDATIAIVSCGSQIFATLAEAKACISSRIVAIDDCKEVVVEPLSSGPLTAECTSEINVTAVAQGCDNRWPEDTTSIIIPVKVNSTPPVVTCELTNNTFSGNGAGVFVDAEFNYSASDSCPGELSVTIDVFSTELDTSGGDSMVLISEPTTSNPIPNIFVEDIACKTGNNGGCQISSGKKSRGYLVRVSATDEAGNVGIGTCNVVVGNAIFPTDDPLFLVASTGRLPSENEIAMI